MADPISVLLVDDEPDLLDFLSKRLNRRGFIVQTASNGRQALAAIGVLPPDVVILDMLMPGGMDGLATLREIRRLFPLVEVLLLTAHASTEAALRGMELGAYDYLIKPVAIGELVLKIEEASGKRGVMASPLDPDVNHDA
ncbi:MAG: response regulator [Pseudodesulfovibrio sp.]|uniref:Response regulator receiver n=1 Tax=Pseudodesulfovibrio aespoeensis (strain ATCC 700646 / DSM 10631 / Aspo-2) TaxID=643562 RepID=E6VUK9_PSEA9|nr:MULTISPECIES: response regulator [Pseudodesulfovibrio]MBU4192899.1 response regulator [Pseudomonadota bacterium]ADU61154.1 response regulator receiver [Pseudodesulfovibrio aespoeensis Aspo-2]MBU4475797.1 response regulator [Pseudomonadota bacterium]MBU4517418.1 response regulator [Pseudomonadota bacterium]MBU4522583.1 response regulator [Pseudomonadota bacterium]